MFKRLYFDRLLAWKNAAKRKPLIIKGARQVGKTSLLKMFGQTYYKDYAYFNFEKEVALHDIFLKTKSPDAIINSLSSIHGRNIIANDTLIILDEIQFSSEALNSLKYFNEEKPEYAIAAAGSLLGITLGSEKTGFPVGMVDFLTIYPMSFEEFLQAYDIELFQKYEKIESLHFDVKLIFDQLERAYFIYLAVGGMPEALTAIIPALHMDNADLILNQIRNTYQIDIAKHAPKYDIPKINYLWNSIPSQLAKENKKFIYSVVKDGARAREYENALLWLEQAGLIYKVYKNEKPELPLSLFDDITSFKLYMLDHGLLRSQSQIGATTFIQTMHTMNQFKGIIAENFVLNHLVQLFDIVPKYWTSQSDAEIDFLVQYKHMIIPIEVKSSDNVRSKSLTYYDKKYAPPLKIRYSLKPLEYNDRLLSIPFYLIGKTKLFIEEVIISN